MGTPNPFRARYGYQQRVVQYTDASPITPNTDTTDIGIVLTLSQTTVIANPVGTMIGFYDGQLFQLRITSSSSRAISFGTAYQAASSLALPSATTGGGAEDYIGFRYNANDAKWDMIACTIGVYPAASTGVSTNLAIAYAVVL